MSLWAYHEEEDKQQNILNESGVLCRQKIKKFCVSLFETIFGNLKSYDEIFQYSMTEEMFYPVGQNITK